MQIEIPIPRVAKNSKGATILFELELIFSSFFSAYNGAVFLLSHIQLSFPKSLWKLPIPGPIGYYHGSSCHLSVRNLLRFLVHALLARLLLVYCWWAFYNRYSGSVYSWLWGWKKWEKEAWIVYFLGHLWYYSNHSLGNSTPRKHWGSSGNGHAPKNNLHVFHLWRCILFLCHQTSWKISSR